MSERKDSYNGLARAIIELNQDIVQSIKDFSNSGHQIALIEKVLWLHALVSGHMSEEGKEKAEELAGNMDRELTKARELFKLINEDSGIITLIESGG